MKEKWDDLGIDALICPAHFHSAYRNQECVDLCTVAQYVCMWNPFHYPAGALPITEVLPGEENEYHDNYNDMITTKIR
jgi:hypothetical protein